MVGLRAIRGPKADRRAAEEGGFPLGSHVNSPQLHQLLAESSD